MFRSRNWTHSIFDLGHGFTEQHEKEYISMTLKGVGIHVITGLKQWVCLAQKVTLIVWFDIQLHLPTIFLSLAMCFQGTWKRNIVCVVGHTSTGSIVAFEHKASVTSRTVFKPQVSIFDVHISFNRFKHLSVMFYLCKRKPYAYSLVYRSGSRK